jgi:OOP family OmpA-OmpF porin
VKSIRLLPALLLSLAATFAFAQQDDPSVKDHPMIPRFPNTVITGGQSSDFSAHEFDLGEGKTRKVEGRHWRIEYAMKEGQKPPGPLQVSRNYGNEFKKRGGAVLMEVVDTGGGSATMRMPSPGGEIWMDLGINNGGEQLVFNIVQVAALKQEIEFSADQMAQALASTGRIALYGILFDTGKDVIKPESEKLLAEVAALLNKDANLKVRIEGHTDNVGKPADNLALSTKRAESVKRWLTAKGIAAARLESAGLGDTRPVAPNTSDDGRAKNRRVELVRK